MNENEVQDACRRLGLDWGPLYHPARGPHMSISCPMAMVNHGDSKDDNKSFSVTVSESTSLGRCFSGNCGVKGAFWWIIKQAIEARGNSSGLVSWLDEVMARERPDFQSRCKRVERYKPEFEELNIRTKIQENRGAVKESDLKRFSPLPDAAMEYLEARGFSDESVIEWEMCWDPNKRRIVFPVRRLDGKLVGFTGRGITEKTVPKWLCYEGLVKTDHLFGEQRLETNCRVVIVEGQPDVVVTAEAVKKTGLKYVPVAPLGEGFSDIQIETIRSLQPSQIIIFPDGDDAGEVWAGKIARRLKRDIPLLAQPAGFKVDPGEMMDEEILKALRDSKTILRGVELACLKGRRRKKR